MRRASRGGTVRGGRLSGAASPVFSRLGGRDSLPDLAAQPLDLLVGKVQLVNQMLRLPEQFAAGLFGFAQLLVESSVLGHQFFEADVEALHAGAKLLQFLKDLGQGLVGRRSRHSR